MKNGNISKILYIVILFILLVNAVTSTANVIEDDAILRRVIPAVCWSIAAIIWTATYFMKGRNMRNEFARANDTLVI